MPIGRDLIRSIRTLDEYDLRRLMIFIRGLLLHSEGALEATAQAESKITYRLEPVKCGKQGCSRCPHGPYWYAYWREGGRMRSRYIGKSLPEGAVPAPQDDRSGP